MNILRIYFATLMLATGSFLVASALWWGVLVVQHGQGAKTWWDWLGKSAGLLVIGGAAVAGGVVLLRAIRRPQRGLRRLSMEQIRRIAIVAYPNGSAVLGLLALEPVATQEIADRVYDGRPRWLVRRVALGIANEKSPAVEKMIDDAILEVEEIYGVGRPPPPKPSGAPSNHMPPGTTAE